MKEYWKQIENSCYYISNLGNVKNNKTGRILKTFIVKKFEHRVEKIKLPINGKRKCYSIHRLMAIAFIPNPKNKKEVDHIDKNGLNNELSNLRWSTKKENCNNRMTISTKDIKLIIKLNNEGKNYEDILFYLRNQ